MKTKIISNHTDMYTQRLDALGYISKTTYRYILVFKILSIKTSFLLVSKPRF